MPKLKQILEEQRVLKKYAEKVVILGGQRVETLWHNVKAVSTVYWSDQACLLVVHMNAFTHNDWDAAIERVYTELHIGKHNEAIRKAIAVFDEFCAEVRHDPQYEDDTRTDEAVLREWRTRDTDQF